jgi:hypothetical protein
MVMVASVVAVVGLADGGYAEGALTLTLGSSVVYLVKCCIVDHGPPHQHDCYETGRDALHEPGDNPINVVPRAICLKIWYVTLMLLRIILMLDYV